MTAITLDKELEDNLIKFLNPSLDSAIFSERLKKLLETIEDLEDYRTAEQLTKDLDYSKTIPFEKIMAKYA